MKLSQRILAIVVSLLLLALPAKAVEQSSIVTPTTGPMSMATFAGTYLNPALRAIQSCNWGTSAPANGPSSLPIVYECWADTTTNPVVFKRYDGASWVVFGKLNTSTHVWTPSFQGTDQTAISALTSAAGINTWIVTPSSANLAAAITDETGSGALVFGTSPLIITPTINLGSDATGDVYYRNSGGAFTRLPIGSNGQALTVSSGLPAWAAVSGTGTVTSAAYSASTGISISGTTPCTTTCTWTIAVDKATASNYYAATSNKVVTTDIIYPSEVTITYGATTTFDFTTFINGIVTLTGNITTQTFSNVMAGKSGTIRYQQSGAGNFTTVWNSILKWPGGSAPSLTTGSATAIDVLTYNCVTATYCQASLAKDVK